MNKVIIFEWFQILFDRIKYNNCLHSLAIVKVLETFRSAPNVRTPKIQILGIVYKDFDISSIISLLRFSIDNAVLF